MSYSKYLKWFNNHYQKHKYIVDKLNSLSDNEIIRYFRFENMVKNEPDFCPLYKKNQKCHDIKDLNCYMCGCSNFRLEDDKSYCAISSKDGKKIKTDNFIHQDCSACVVPHDEEFIKKYFHKDWKQMMSEVL